VPSVVLQAAHLKGILEIIQPLGRGLISAVQNDDGMWVLCEMRSNQLAQVLPFAHLFAEVQRRLPLGSAQHKALDGARHLVKVAQSLLSLLLAAQVAGKVKHDRALDGAFQQLPLPPQQHLLHAFLRGIRGARCAPKRIRQRCLKLLLPAPQPGGVITGCAGTCSHAPGAAPAPQHRDSKQGDKRACCGHNGPAQRGPCCSSASRTWPLLGAAGLGTSAAAALVVYLRPGVRAIL